MDPRQPLIEPAVVRLAWAQRAIAAGIVLFWAFFAWERSRLPEALVDHEIDFIVPDIAWIAGLLVVASRWLLARDRRGFVASAAAAGALVFLGLLDISYNVRHGQYVTSLGDGLLNAAINVAAVGFGLWSLAQLFRLSRNSVPGR